MAIVIAIGMVVGSLCLVFLSIVLPWMAFDEWRECFGEHSVIALYTLMRAIGLTWVSALVWAGIWKLLRLARRVVRDESGHPGR